MGARYRHAPRIAAATQPSNHAAMSVEIGDAASGRAQHAGLGKQLIERAADIARQHGYQKLAVISAIGTREYYRKRGFADGVLYQLRALN